MGSWQGRVGLETEVVGSVYVTLFKNPLKSGKQKKSGLKKFSLHCLL